MPLREVSRPTKGSDRGPPDSETHVSPYSRHGRSQSSAIRLDARSEAPTERTPGTSRTYPLPKAREMGLQIPERIVLITRRTPRRSPPTGRFDQKAKLLIQRTYELGLSAASRARSGQGSHQLYLDVASHQLTRRQNTVL